MYKRQEQQQNNCNAKYGDAEEVIAAFIVPFGKGCAAQKSGSTENNQGDGYPDVYKRQPFAFTGNKFEFRMLGSMFSIAGPNIVLNTIVAEELDEFADKLADAPDLEAAVYDLVKETYKAHKRIVFNGNGYTDAWVEEAAKRGLLNLKSTPEALPYLGHAKNIELFEKHNIFTKAEVESRVEILLENYSTTISIEAATMLDMFHKDCLLYTSNKACVR